MKENSINEEEKKAIEYLEKYTKWETYGERNLEKDIMTALNLIEKQQKEIEELKQEMKKRKWVRIKENGEVEPLLYISKDKIKDKIEKLNKKEKEELKRMKGQDRYFVKQIYQTKRIILQELIEEREEN